MKTEEIAEELWDKYSEHIDDNLFSLDSVAGTSVITSRRLFLKAVNEAVELSNESKWISVANRLPEPDQKVLVHCSGDRHVTAIFNPTFGKKCFYAYDLLSEQLSRVEEPIHWQPLPESPTK